MAQQQNAASEVPLTDYCFEARIAYPQGYRLLLEGTLHGRRVGKRWFVTLDAAAHRIRTAQTIPVAATA